MSKGEQINVKELKNVKSVTVYKIVGGEFDSLVVSFNWRCQQSHATRTDWSALYTQFKRQYVLGTLPYRCERTTHATLLEITFENVNILSIEGALMQDSSVDGRSKAAVIKQLLNVNPNEVLMETIRKRNNVSPIPETEDECELVIPHDLLDVLEHSERVVARFRKGMLPCQLLTSGIEERVVGRVGKKMMMLYPILSQIWRWGRYHEQVRSSFH
jgi:hypothetical protein